MYLHVTHTRHFENLDDDELRYIVDILSSHGDILLEIYWECCERSVENFESLLSDLRDKIFRARIADAFAEKDDLIALEQQKRMLEIEEITEEEIAWPWPITDIQRSSDPGGNPIFPMIRARFGCSAIALGEHAVWRSTSVDGSLMRSFYGACQA